MTSLNQTQGINACEFGKVPLAERSDQRSNACNHEAGCYRQAQDQREKAIRGGDFAVDLVCDFLLMDVGHDVGIPFSD
jgi:hypothetical protein